MNYFQILFGWAENRLKLKVKDVDWTAKIEDKNQWATSNQNRKQNSIREETVKKSKLERLKLFLCLPLLFLNKFK